ncbi:acyl-CoA desaturase [Flavipsychrobacter stenotrophus]|uniref:Acyl-CoA desaturase n=1 Tax=Flavipsychrobacter stenotrophus TaxID=2077091 RepID=A0A2S7SUX4_9BACT|nr:acyl-CoA desaturase [Flavipsychrobacter stenotrophus]PQJ10405.1 acyl-CoA desaturase [Flavipsychrobacter stenotrophus]
MAKLTYNNKKAVFFQALKTEVDGYFTKNGIEKTGNWKLYAKTVILISLSIGLYLSLLTFHFTAFAGIALSMVLGLTLAGVGFNVMHDANHGSYSSKKWVNDLLGLTLNALGSNAFIWRQKHNIIHHTYTNVDGIDDDIAKSPVIRQCSTQVWKPAHKVQHIYLWLAYALSSILWIFVTDFVKYGSKMVYTTPLKKMDTKEHAIFWISKVMYVAFYIALPIYLVGVSTWAVGYLAMNVALGMSLSVVFQLAHVVEETEFEFSGADDKVIENEWAVHQLKTTADFARGNKVISWYVGGLNYQVEHHLFPRISHVHYPEVSKIVEQKCKEYNVDYHAMPTMWAAIGSHYRFMKSLGQKPQEVPPQATKIKESDVKAADLVLQEA